MDANSSAEELTIKARKPYTITKQRERWTEEEHNRFLEALKLYGRAWQRIEEHIGTKTAVQIRSHAQKFFSKLEKEALIKGMPLGQSLDLDIPPPRPKRKPSNPYPRKTSTSAPTSSLVGVKDGTASSLNQSKQTLDLEKDPSPEKPEGTEKTARAKEILDKDSCSEVLNFFQEIPYSSISSESRSSIPPMVLKNPCAFGEFEPSMKEISDLGATDESHLTVEPKGNQKLGRKNSNNTDMDNGASETSKLDRSYPNSYEKLVQGERTDASKESEKRLLPTNEVQTNQNYPGHVPVQFMEGVSGTCMETPTPGVTCPASIIHQVGGAHGNPHLFANPTASVTNEHHSNMSRSSIRQSSPTFPPTFTPFCNNQDNYRSYLNFSNFSTLMVSNLLQNPAAHAAASLTASFWPCTSVETPLDSSSGTLGGFPLRHMSPFPNMAAIAAATVAAASAWWATHGMLPLCPPFHTGFTCTPEPVTAMPSTDTGQPPVVNRERKNTPQDPPWEDQQLDPEFSEAPKKRSASKSPPMSSSDSEESGGARSNSTELKEHAPKPLQATGFHDPNKAKTRKQVDRSSCGSNTPSSSEVETDTLEKCEKGEEDSKELELSHVSGEANNRRSRSTSNMNESWKEVSEEGRLAFQALFSREILPQSFSPPQDQRSKGQPRYSTEEEKQNSSKKIEDQVPLDLSGTWGTCPDHSGVKDELLGSSNNAEKGLLMTGLGHPKLKARRTGFKPYKRCSLEAKENRIPNGNGQVGEKDPKRIRLEGEVLT